MSDRRIKVWVSENVLSLLTDCFTSAEAGGFEGDLHGSDERAIRATDRWIRSSWRALNKIQKGDENSE